MKGWPWKVPLPGNESGPVTTEPEEPEKLELS
jgi:hypothetical protein